jgi:hypothetical protein
VSSPMLSCPEEKKRKDRNGSSIMSRRQMDLALLHGYGEKGKLLQELSGAVAAPYIVIARLEKAREGGAELPPLEAG